MSEEARQIIKRCRFFRGLNDESFERILSMAIVKKYRRGELIFNEGDPCPGIYIVGEGAVRIFKNAPTGKQHVLHLAYEGSTFAEVAAIGEFACPAFAEAIQDTVCVLLPQNPFIQEIKRDHALCIQLLGSMAGWVHHLVGMLEDIVLRDATSRVARHLLRTDIPEQDEDFLLPMLKRDLASHLNLTSETLSRTLRRLTQAGLIGTPDQHHIRIINKTALEDVAEGLPPAEFT
jgi:CRP/FNR family transcriptional regulator